MQPEDRESWLWWLGELAESETRGTDPEDDHQPVQDVSDADLEAYRSGQLEPEAVEKVEQSLISHPHLRRRLLELADLPPEAPSEALRRRVLGTEATEEQSSRSRVRRGPRFSGLRIPGLAAASLAAAALLLVWFRPQEPDPGTSLPAYQVSIEALEGRRGQGDPPGTAPEVAKALRSTSVTITAVVQEAAEGPLQVGLYGVRENHLRRLDTESGVTVVERRGAVLFRALAETLVGSRPGVWELLVVISRTGEEVPEERSQEEIPLDSFADSQRFQVHRLSLRLLAESSALPNLGTSPTDEEVLHASNRDLSFVVYPGSESWRLRLHHSLGPLSEPLLRCGEAS